MESIYENFKGSNVLVVAFQAHDGTVFGTTVDEFKGMLSQLDYDTLKINDTNGNYFFNGIDETYDTFEKVLGKLSEYISGYTKTVFMGNCAGGHAAVLFGTMLNVNKVIGFNTVSYLDQSTLQLNDDGRDDQVSFLDQSIQYLNLKPYLENTVYNTQIYSIVAQNTDKHVKQSNNISTCPNVSIEMIDCEIPQVAYYLMRKNQLISKIEQIIESN
jgi:hypothetical protein